MLTDYIPCKKCVLWLDDYDDDVSKLIVELRRIASSEAAFNEYMEWKKNPDKVIMEKLLNHSMIGQHLICRMAEKHLEYQANKGNYAHPWETQDQPGDPLLRAQPGVRPYWSARLDSSSHSFLINQKKHHFETLDATWPKKVPNLSPSWPMPPLKLNEELAIQNKTEKWQIDISGLVLAQTSEYKLENFVTGKPPK